MSLHAPRVAPEKLTPHQPGDVQFSGDTNEVDMVIEKIALEGIKDRAGRSIQAWIGCHPDGDRKTKTDDVIVYLRLLGSGPISGYSASQFIRHAVISDEDFIVSDGFDGKHDIHIPASEVAKLARSALSAIPPTMGGIRISVDFEPINMSVPF